jgi:hypothetical protein
MSSTSIGHGTKHKRREAIAISFQMAIALFYEFTPVMIANPLQKFLNRLSFFAAKPIAFLALPTDRFLERVLMTQHQQIRRNLQIILRWNSSRIGKIMIPKVLL